MRIIYSDCRAIIPLDTEKIRRNALRTLKKNKSDCAALDAKLTQFEKKERLAHQQWIQTHCGAEITECRALHEEIVLLENTLNLASDLDDFYPNRTRQDCVDAAVRFFETNGKTPEGYEAFFNPSHAQEKDDSDPFEDADDDAKFSKDLDEDFRLFEEEFNDLFSRILPDKAPVPTRAEYRREQKAIKGLYRRIARRLHPDKAGVTTPDQQELWHAAQAAYEAHDRETLERIDAHCDLLDTENTRFAPVSSIQTSIAFYKKACAQFRRSINLAKHQPEWGFLSWTEQKKQRVLQTHAQELSREIQFLIRQRDARKNHLKKMSQRSAASKKTAPKHR